VRTSPLKRPAGPHAVAASALDVKTRRKRACGIIVRIHPKGFAFIKTPDAGDFFVSIRSMRDRAHWIEQQPVSFLPGNAKPGTRTAPPAFDVAAISLDEYLERTRGEKESRAS